MYKTLPAIDAIRLLRLHPHQEGGEIQCTLETTHISANPTYTALSYERGQAINTKSINLNEQQFHVRENLWRFLSQLSRTQVDRLLWVDAICINQDDIVERSQQVQIMAQIYKSASSVWIWLGVDSGDIGDAFQSIRSLRKLELESTGRVSYVKASMNALHNALHNAMLDLSSRTYFTRTWIIQEVILARELVIYCGEHSIEWNVFIEWAVFKYNLPDTAMILLAQARSRRQEHERTDGYASLMSDFGTSQCSEIRDKVYGLLGLLPEYRDRLRVDYAIPISVLFFQTLSLFEEGCKVRSAEDLRKSLGLAWAQLYSVPQGLGRSSSSSIANTTTNDSPSSIRVLLLLVGSVREIEPCRQLFPHGPGHRRPNANQPRRRYFTFRFPHRIDDLNEHSYGLSATQIVHGDRLYVFMEVRAAVIVRRADSGKLAGVGGATMSTSLQDRLALLAERPDHARLAVLRDGLFSGMEVTERGDAWITVQDLEGALTTASAR